MYKGSHKGLHNTTNLSLRIKVIFFIGGGGGEKVWCRAYLGLFLQASGNENRFLLASGVYKIKASGVFGPFLFMPLASRAKYYRRLDVFEDPYSPHPPLLDE